MPKPKAYTVFLFLEAATALLFGVIFTMSSLYQVQTANLSASQLVLVGTALEFSIFVFEIPTGVVADVVSRRLSIIVGVFLIGAGFVLEGALPVFATILLAQVLWGLGYTFTSGATQAWITDEIGEEAAGPAFLPPASSPTWLPWWVSPWGCFWGECSSTCRFWWVAAFLALLAVC